MGLPLGSTFLLLVIHVLGGYKINNGSCWRVVIGDWDWDWGWGWCWLDWER